jgi:hypothetical protein
MGSMARDQFPVGVRNFSVLHIVQTGSGAHPASYAVDTETYFHRGKVAGV